MISTRGSFSVCSSADGSCDMIKISRAAIEVTLTLQLKYLNIVIISQVFFSVNSSIIFPLFDWFS